MQIITKKIDEIKPYERNPRNNDDAVKYVANSIKEFGFKVPIIVDKDGVIVAGHTRYRASQQLGLKEVPCIIADDLTEEQIKKFRIADNKTGEIAFWDNEILRQEFADLQDFTDMSDFGFGEFELNILTGDYEPDDYDDDLIKEYTKQSDSFLKKNRLIINYTEEETELVKKLLNVEEVKVLYDIKELIEDE